MPLIQQDSRYKQKRSTLAGIIPTRNTGSTNHTDGTWTDEDIYSGEFFINTTDNKVWFGSSTSVHQIYPPVSGLTSEDVKLYTTFGDFPVSGSADKLYITKDTSTAYYWDTAAYFQLSISSITWDSIVGKPSATTYQIDQSVLLSHDQNALNSNYLTSGETDLRYVLQESGSGLTQNNFTDYYKNIIDGWTNEIQFYDDETGFPAIGSIDILYIAKLSVVGYIWDTLTTTYIPFMGGSALSTLSDVSLSTLNLGDVLTYDGSKWINSASTITANFVEKTETLNNGFIPLIDGSNTIKNSNIQYDITKNTTAFGTAVDDNVTLKFENTKNVAFGTYQDSYGMYFWDKTNYQNSYGAYILNGSMADGRNSVGIEINPTAFYADNQTNYGIVINVDNPYTASTMKGLIVDVGASTPNKENRYIGQFRDHRTEGVGKVLTCVDSIGNFVWSASTGAVDLSGYYTKIESDANFLSANTSYVDGSGLANRVAYWSDSNTLTSSAEITFTPSNYLYLGNSSSDYTRIDRYAVIVNDVSEGYTELTNDALHYFYHHEPSFGGWGGTLNFNRSRGDATTPTSAQTGDYIFRVNGSGYNGANYVNTFAMYSQIKEDFTDGENHYASAFYIDTISSGSTFFNTKFEITGDGNIMFNNAYRFPKTIGSYDQVLTKSGTTDLVWKYASIQDYKSLYASTGSYTARTDLIYNGDGGSFEYVYTIYNNITAAKRTGRIHINKSGLNLTYTDYAAPEIGVIEAEITPFIVDTSTVGLYVVISGADSYYINTDLINYYGYIPYE